MSDAQPLAIEADRADAVRLRPLAVQHPCALEPAAIAGQAAGDDHACRQVAREAVDQTDAVDAEPVGEHEHRPQAAAGELGGQAGAGIEGVTGVGDRGGGQPQFGVLEAGYGEAEAGAANLAAGDLARGRAADQQRLREGGRQLFERRRIGRVGR